jgi:hypothetical protein
MSGVLVIIFRNFFNCSNHAPVRNISDGFDIRAFKDKTTFQGFSDIGFYTCGCGFTRDPGITGSSREFSGHFPVISVA